MRNWDKVNGFTLLGHDILWSIHPDDPPDVLGILPSFISAFDADDAVTQLKKNYGHGGGWEDWENYDIHKDLERNAYWLKFHSDAEKLQQIAITRLRDETIVLFEYSMVAVFPWGDHSISRLCRMD